MANPDIPRVDVVSQSIAVSGFTDDGYRSGRIDLTKTIPAGSIVLGWKGEITTRFTGGVGNGAELTVGTPDDTTAFSAEGYHPMQGGRPNRIGDVPAAGGAVDGIELARTVRVTVRDAFDFGNVKGGALDLYVYFVRTAV